MKTDFGRLFGVAVSSAVLASLCTWIIGFGVMSVLETDDVSDSQPASGANEQELSELRSQIESLFPTGKGTAEIVKELDKNMLASSFLANSMSQAFIEQYVTHTNGYANLSLSDAPVTTLHLSDAVLDHYPSWSTQPWKNYGHHWGFDPYEPPTGLFARQMGDYSTLNLDIQEYILAGKDTVDCGPDYSVEVCMAANIFRLNFLPDVQITEIAKSISVSGTLQPDASDPQAPTDAQAYTLMYPVDLPQNTTTNLIPYLPTVIISPREQGTAEGTLLVWSAYAYSDALRSDIQKLSADITTRTTVTECPDYGGCY